MWLGIWPDMRLEMQLHMWPGMFTGVCIDVCTDVHTKNVHRHANRRMAAVCIDCSQICVQTSALIFAETFV